MPIQEYLRPKLSNILGQIKVSVTKEWIQVWNTQIHNATIIATFKTNHQILVLILYLKSKKPINDKQRSSNLKREVKGKLKCGRHCNELSVIWSQRYLCNIIRDGCLKSVPMRENTDQKNIEYGHFTQCKMAPVLRLSVNNIYEFRYDLSKYLQRLRKSLLTCLIL